MDWRSSPKVASLTPFQVAVLELCAAIPAGKVATYGSLAGALGDAKLSRAVGTALKNNPFAPTVPCHRVIKTGRPPTIGGFCGHLQSKGDAEVCRKRELLKSEGVQFDDQLRLKTIDALLLSDQFDKAAVKRAEELLLRKKGAK